MQVEQHYVHKNVLFLNNNFFKTLKSGKQKAVKEINSRATRKSSELTLNALTNENNTLIGGSADLAGSNNTNTKHHKITKPSDFGGDYIHYGVREHAMSGIMNGLALHSNFIPYGGTFLIFSDYCKPSIRLSALMQQRVIYVMTHDSIGVGEDGPTHQPVEQIPSLRSIPNLKRKYSLCDIQPPIIQFNRLRPRNFPTIRWAQLAELYSVNKAVFSNLIQNSNHSSS